MRSVLLFLLCLPLSAFADAGLPTAPYIYVQGHAEVKRAADKVNLRFEISALDPDQAKANEQVQAQAAQVFALLDKSKIPKADVIAGDLTSEPEYEEDENGIARRGKLLGYRVTRPFTVEVRDLAAFPSLVDQILALRVFAFTGVTEGLTNAKAMEEEVWDKAIANARERAEKTLKAAGSTIESLYAISPVAFPEIVPGIFGDSRQTPMPVAAGPSGKQDFNPSAYRLAPVSVSQTVHIIYLIRPAR